ncbi:hypothetical protein HMPREF1531_01809 [Propionibacterium sp. oral taxon 192 str. F0372]|mgnify:CR=1 FL=1|uniref:O-methyltransferase n=1 Tax=Propionibacterium sp. oral taxon 192 TaxID=671222 RepID=UPI000353467B|nr:class I SAM-dependent methyltransferase [Propionibacterium sp. oral taxon 192]EPH02501.1 hypothetical protein HMPREF1531_01809 [Propionibacterium sp. oral taxon 192 str. F0372]
MSEEFLLDKRSIAFAEDFVPGTEPMDEAHKAAVLAGAPASSGGVNAVLTMLAKLINARTVVEVGTSTGCTGLALFQGMDPAGVLTSIDTETDWQNTAKTAFRAAGIASQRSRLINGRALDICNNLRAGAYDIMLLNDEKLDYLDFVPQAERLLRPGGMLVINDALWQGKVADPNDDSDESVIIREALDAIRESEVFTCAMLPVGHGVAVGVHA